MLTRVETWSGTATVIVEEISGSGKPVVRVLLDNGGIEKVFLQEFVTESDKPAPEAAKAKPARKPRTRELKPEPISDELLVTPAPPPAVQLDPIDVDELPDELRNEPEIAEEMQITE